MINDATAISITNALFSLIGTIFTGVIAYLIHRLDQKAVGAARQVDLVKEALAKNDAKTDVKLEEIAKTGKVVHVLVNSARGDQLRLAASLSRRIAMLTGDPRDSEEADRSESLLEDHERQQRIVDENQGEV